MRKLLTGLLAAGAIAVAVGFTSAAGAPGEPRPRNLLLGGADLDQPAHDQGLRRSQLQLPRGVGHLLARPLQPPVERPPRPARPLPARPLHVAERLLRRGADRCAQRHRDQAPPGHTNPFIAGALRDGTKRSYEVRVLNQQPPPSGSPRAPNTLYAKPGPGASIELLYRVYEPDRGLDLTGGTGLPRPVLKMADGSTATGAAACAAINDPGPLDPGADRARGDLAGRALNPALRPADEPRVRPAALGALLQPELRAARRGQRLHRRGPAGRGWRWSRGAGRLLLQPRQRLHLRAPQPRLRPPPRRAGTAAAVCPHGHAPHAHARREASLLVALHRRVAGHDPHPRLPRRPPGPRPQRPRLHGRGQSRLGPPTQRAPAMRRGLARLGEPR